MDKAASNVEKHGVSFAEAQTVFADPLSITTLDPDHSENETRWIIVGQFHQRRLLFVAHTFRDKQVRVIPPNRALVRVP